MHEDCAALSVICPRRLFLAEAYRYIGTSMRGIMPCSQKKNTFVILGFVLPKTDVVPFVALVTFSNRVQLLT
jgi:hypothetical protein